MEPSIRIISTTTNLSRTDYGRNGNMVSDPSRGIFAIYYNPLNLPTGITMNSGARFDYLYSAAGTKLAEIIYEPDADTPTVRRDYAGIFEFENSSLARISLASGYITPSQELLPTKPTDPFTPITPNDPDITNDLIPSLPGKPTFPLQPTLDLTATYHLYAFDHQGNILGVYNTKTATLEQTTDYYPYGLPHATASATSPYDRNRRLYSAKELTTEAGLNTYDFTARLFSASFPLFGGVDIMSEQSCNSNPYAFCNNDPINLCDPTGLFSIRNASQETHYEAIFVLPLYDVEDPVNKSRTYEELVNKCFKSLNDNKIPFVLVKDIKDFSKALTALKEMNTTTNIYVITGHGYPGNFPIGNVRVDSKTDISVLKSGLENHIIFLNGCQVAKGDIGTELLKQIAKAINCMVFASEYAIDAPNLYDKGVFDFTHLDTRFSKENPHYRNNFKFAHPNGIVLPAYNVKISMASGLSFSVDYYWSVLSKRMLLNRFIREVFHNPMIESAEITFQE